MSRDERRHERSSNRPPPAPPSRGDTATPRDIPVTLHIVSNDHVQVEAQVQEDTPQGPGPDRGGDRGSSRDPGPSSAGTRIDNARDARPSQGNAHAHGERVPAQDDSNAGAGRSARPTRSPPGTSQHTPRNMGDNPLPRPPNDPWRQAEPSGSQPRVHQPRPTHPSVYHSMWQHDPMHRTLTPPPGILRGGGTGNAQTRQSNAHAAQAEGGARDAQAGASADTRAQANGEEARDNRETNRTRPRSPPQQQQQQPESPQQGGGPRVVNQREFLRGRYQQQCDPPRQTHSHNHQHLPEADRPWDRDRRLELSSEHPREPRPRRRPHDHRSPEAEPPPERGRGSPRSGDRPRHRGRESRRTNHRPTTVNDDEDDVWL
ncbi:hypothetical protein BV20DRAFT_714421 [Pilatotrama ljubarskyi]|nr:hypothetical protein BV20DRAFT_714421 [Pilatotrama ljubarskyi]